MAGDQEDRAPEHLGRPDQAVHLVCRETVEERVEQADSERQRADEEDEGAEPVDPKRLVGPPAPGRVGERAVAPHLLRRVDGAQQRRIAAGAEEEAACEVDGGARRGVSGAELRFGGAEGEERAPDREGDRGYPVQAAQPPRERRCRPYLRGLAARLGANRDRSALARRTRLPPGLAGPWQVPGLPAREWAGSVHPVDDPTLGTAETAHSSALAEPDSRS